MTRPDKHAARFGVRHRPVTVADILRALRVPGRFYVPPPEPVDYWTFTPHTANMAAPTVAELEAGTEIRGLSRMSFAEWNADVRAQPVRPAHDILDRIDDTLLTYDSQHADGDEPWPYRGF